MADSIQNRAKTYKRAKRGLRLSGLICLAGMKVDVF